MATYYKYAEREADSQVNWAEIGKNMSDMLANENKIREQKKQAIDQASRDYAEQLANYPTGQSESARAMALKFGDDASKYMLMQDKLLKSGQMKLGDYTVTRQNLLDDTETTFNMLKDFQNRYGIKMDRYKKGESQKWELEAMERIEGFGKFADSGMYIDPTTGKVTIAMKEKDPVTGLMVMGKNPSQRASVPSVRGMLEGQWDKYNPNQSLDMINQSIGDNIQTIRKIGRRTQAGEIMTVTDVLASTRKEVDINSDIAAKEAQIKSLEGKTDKKSLAAKSQLQKEIADSRSELEASKAIFNFKEFETKAINMELENPWNRLSLMTDNMGKAPNGEMYHFVYTKEEADKDESAIYMEPSLDSGNSYQPKFSEKQKEASTEFMRNQLRGRYDYKEQRQTVSDYQAPQQQQQWQYEAGKDKKQSGDLLSQWQKLYSAGNAADKRAAAQSLLGNPKLMEMGITNIDMSDGKNVNLIYANGTSRTIPLYTEVDGKEVQVSPTQWAAQGTELHGVTDSNEFNKYKGDTFQNVSDWSGVNAVRTVATTSPQTTADPYTSLQSALGSVTDADFVETDDNLAAILTQKLGPLGFTFKSNEGGGGNQYVTVTPPGGASSFTVDANSYTGGTSDRNSFLDEINARINAENAKSILGSGVGGKW
jgi:hypothetical protein